MSFLRKPSLFYFYFFWAVVFILYLPAAKAGFVTDFTGWLDQVRNHGFWEYINQTNYHVKSLYQFTQFNTYIIYQAFGANAWAWHLLFVTLQAVNSFLLFRLFKTLFTDAGIQRARTIAATGVFLFCVSPYLSEVVVWEPSFHYLQGLLLILLILTRVQKFFRSPLPEYAWQAAIIFFLSTYSLEIFYITPWLVLSMALYYRFGLGYDKLIFRKILLFFFVPELLLFGLHLLTYRYVHGGWVAHIGTATIADAPASYLGKPAKYLFHIIFLGRFFPQQVRQSVYEFCDSTEGIVLFYAVVVSVFAWIICRFRVMTGKQKALSLLYVWVFITLLILLPLWFGDMLLVLFDRYTYFTNAFLYTLLVLLASFISSRYIATALVVVYALINIRLAIKLSRFWGKSAKVISSLLYNIPDPGNKTLILLNLPESLKGTAMIGSEDNSEYKLMHNLLLPDKRINAPVYDAVSFNMLTPDDGAHVNVLNDSTVRVTLNQWGTWWWYRGKGGHSYQNADYSLNMIDDGHYYELTLKRPPQQYLLLYEVGAKWHVVDWTKKNQDQN